MAFEPIENYGVIGNMQSIALVGMNGSIDLFCYPEFDSPTVFAALLDDQTGAIRDVVQNHLFQVLSNLSMEPPVQSDSESIRDERVKVLKAIPPIEEKDLVRGQFRGYRNENGVAKDSQTETFAGLKLQVNSWRWKGVPFYIRAGKCLPTTCTEIVGKFRKPPTLIPDTLLVENHLRLRLNPDITIRDGDDEPTSKLGRICASDRRNGGQPLSTGRRDGCIRT